MPRSCHPSSSYIGGTTSTLPQFLHTECPESRLRCRGDRGWVVEYTFASHLEEPHLQPVTISSSLSKCSCVFHWGDSQAGDKARSRPKPGLQDRSIKPCLNLGRCAYGVMVHKRMQQQPRSSHANVQYGNVTQECYERCLHSCRMRSHPLRGSSWSCFICCLDAWCYLFGDHLWRDRLTLHEICTFHKPMRLSTNWFRTVQIKG